MAKRRNNKKTNARSGYGSRLHHEGASAQACAKPVAEPLSGDPHNRIAVVGGGAAGLAAAVAAGREAALRGHAVQVVVFEADERVGRSIFATGNGRCNFSNASIDAGQYRNSDFVAKALASLEAHDVCLRQRSEAARDVTAASGEGAFGALGREGTSPQAGALGCEGVSPQAGALPFADASASEDPVHRFFSDLGLIWREEAEGRLYPATGKASTVVDVLRFAAHGLGVVEACERRVASIEPPREEGGLFHLRFSDGRIEHAASVIVTVGGKHAFGLGDGNPSRTGGRGRAFSGRTPEAAAASAQTLLPATYDVSSFEPVLGPLAVSEQAPRQLDNIRVRVRIELRAGGPFGTVKAEQAGEVLFRSYGVSGICVFNLSRFAEAGDRLLVNFMPQMDEASCVQFLEERCRRLSASVNALFPNDAPVTNEALLRGMLLPAVAHAVLVQAGLDPQAAFQSEAAPNLAAALTRFPLTVTGVGDARQCQVMRGGLSVGQFDPATLESRIDAGLFAAGEALDVDAPCGGYNLHWAWASGLLAGAAAARKVAGAATQDAMASEAAYGATQGLTATAASKRAGYSEASAESEGVDA